MNPKDLDRILFLTRHFHQLQGLRWLVPAGLIGLGAGLGSMLLPGYPGLLVAVLAGAVFVSLRSRSFYLERFGHVEPQRQAFGEWLATGISLLVITGIEPLARWGLYPASLGLYAALAVLFLGNFLSAKGEARWDQGHHLGLGALFLLLALPTSGMTELFPWRSQTDLEFILGGAALILAGLLDHQFLVQTLERLGAPLPAAPAG